MYLLGNEEILSQHKTAFFCSRHCSANAILESYDWAIAQCESGCCVISGFHSKIEKDVLHFLLKGNQPILLALARSVKQRFEPEIMHAIEKGRLLTVTPFDESVNRATPQTAFAGINSCLRWPMKLS